MERNYTRTWLVGLAVLFSGAALAQAQEPPPVRMLAEGPTLDQNVQPIGPIEGGTVADAQLFKQPDLTQIGTYPELNYGPWFQYERLFWSLKQPATRPIGDPSVAAAAGSFNDLDTGFMNAGFVWGNRFDLGYVLEDDTGWETSILKTNTQFNTLNANTPTTVFFQNNEGHFLGTTIPYVVNTVPTYSSIIVSNTTRMVGIELMRTIRYPVGHDGGIWTFLYGARFFQMHDRFDIEAPTTGTEVQITGGGTPFGEFLQPSAAPNSFDLGIDNNLVGPQIGLGWEHDDQRWTVGTSIRAMIAANFQNATEYGYTGSGTTYEIITPPVPPATTPTTTSVGTIGIAGQPINTFHNTLDTVEFAPLGEFRLDAEYKVTNNVSLKVGYTALIVSGIGRAANRIEYTLPNSGISSGGDKEHFFADGVTFGFEINR